MMKRKWKQWMKNSAAFALAVTMVLQTGVSASVYAASPETAVTVEADENGEQENAFEAVNEDLTAKESGLSVDAEISEDSETDQESDLPVETDIDEAEAESEDENVESEDEATASDVETDEVTMEDEFAEEEAATVLADTEATETDDYSYGFTVNSWSSSSIFKKITQYSRNEDGTNTFTAEFLTTADEAWIDENITFTVENVMPPAYTNMFETMGGGGRFYAGLYCVFRYVF